MTAARTPEEVLAEHQRYIFDTASGWFLCRGCRAEVETSLRHVDDEFRAHQAQALRDAGLLVTPPTAPCCAMRVGIDSGYLVDLHDHCTCAGDLGGHEFGCGMTPLGEVEGLAEHDREVAARALEEAAAAWQTGGWSGSFPAGANRPALILGMAQRATTWLRERADRVRRGEE